MNAHLFVDFRGGLAIPIPSYRRSAEHLIFEAALAAKWSEPRSEAASKGIGASSLFCVDGFSMAAALHSAAATTIMIQTRRYRPGVNPTKLGAVVFGRRSRLKQAGRGIAAGRGTAGVDVSCEGDAVRPSPVGLDVELRNARFLGARGVACSQGVRREVAHDACPLGGLFDDARDGALMKAL
ncbi:MAG: hypothetical protein JWN04_6537, partial [Myxococcaceae bacterium]|nr:hypothetical protein [Myxococcaceae bacterium]